MTGGRGGNDLPTPHSPKHCKEGEERRAGEGRYSHIRHGPKRHTFTHFTSGATRVIQVPFSLPPSLSLTQTLTCVEGFRCSTAPPRATGAFVSPRDTPEAPLAAFAAFPYKCLCCTVPQGGSVLTITLHLVSRSPFRVRRSPNPDEEKWKKMEGGGRRRGEGRGEK